MADPLIELDLSVPWQPPDEAVPVTRPGSRSTLLTAAAVLLVAALLTGGRDGSGIPAPVFLGPSTAEVATITTDRLYIVTDVDRDPVTLNAYRLSDRHLLWSVPIRHGSEVLRADEKRVLILDSGPDRSDPSVEARTADGGRLLWRYDNTEIAAAAGDLVVAQVAESDTWIGLDGATGATRWRVDLRPDSLASLIFPTDGVAGSFTDDTTGDFYDASVLAELDPDRTLRVHDLRTGAVTHAVRLPGDDPVDRFDVIGDQVITYLTSQNNLTVYDLATGRRDWATAFDQRDTLLSPCGPVLCRSTEGEVAGIDPMTGLERWVYPSPNGFTLLGDGRTVVIQTPITADDRRTDAVLVDGGTGTVRRRLGNWHFISDLDDDRLLVWSVDVRGQARIGALDPTDGAIDLFGTAANWFGEPGCAVSGKYVACENMLVLSIWRLPG